LEANGVADQNPKFAKAYAARGDAYASGGDYARAVADYDQALTFDLTVKSQLALI
jgi:tetratricopeptide (TPR) repeat protein